MCEKDRGKDEGQRGHMAVGEMRRPGKKHEGKGNVKITCSRGNLTGKQARWCTGKQHRDPSEQGRPQLCN